MKKYRVWCVSWDEESDDGTDIEAVNSRQAAEKAADYYHARRGGWESSWPLVFAVATLGSSEKHEEFDVEREFVPDFMASLRAGADESFSELPCQEQPKAVR